MGILVNKNATFEVSFLYQLVKNSDNQTIGVRVFDDNDSIPEDCLEFKSLWVPATHEEMTYIREESSVINHVNEKAILLLKEFRPRLICSLCYDWNLVDEEGTSLPITREVISNMYEIFVIKIIEEWKKATGSKEKIHSDNTWERITKDLVQDILSRILANIEE